MAYEINNARQPRGKRSHHMSMEDSMTIYRITTQKVVDGVLGEVVDIVEMESDREFPSSYDLWQDYVVARRKDDPPVEHTQ